MSSVRLPSSSRSFFVGKLGFVRLFILTAVGIIALTVVGTSGAKQFIFGSVNPVTKATAKGNLLARKNYDIRMMDRSAVEQQLAKSTKGFGFREAVNFAVRQRTSIDAGFSRLKATKPDAEITFSNLTGAVEQVTSLKGFTPSSTASGEAIVRGFLANNGDVYGLSAADVDEVDFIAESDSPTGLRMVRAEQTVNGRPIFQSETRFIMSRDGRITNTLGLMVPDAAASALPLDNLLTPSEALQRTASQLDISASVGSMSVTPDPKDEFRSTIRTRSPQIDRPVDSKLVYFPVAPGLLVPAFSQTIFSTDADWYVLVDARDGTMLWRKNIRDDVSTQQARFSVFVQADGSTPADSPSPLSPTTATTGSNTQPAALARTDVSMLTVQNLVASPNGWIDDGATTTTGNNTDTYLDTDDSDGDDAGSLDNNGRPTGNLDAFARNRDFLGTNYNYTPPPNPGSEAGTAFTDTQMKRGVVTQLFYMTNWYHDKLYALGFNTGAANFQNNNFGGPGVGNDRVLAEAQDSVANAATNSNRNNANFSTPNDGTSGRMQMYIFTGPTIDRDGSLDAEVVLHELTHGTSNRIIGNGAGLDWDVGAGMGEGWSDFYALSLLNNTASDDPNGKYADGGYATYKLASAAFTDNYLYGIRRFPYSTDNTINPMTWADVDDITNSLTGGIAASPLTFNNGGAMEVHNAGEIWCLTLWEVRSRVIAANANNVPVGNQAMLQLVTDGLKNTPLQPSFTEARDALLTADCTANAACPNEASIWGGFADRGLGYNAIGSIKRLYGLAAPHMGIGESFDSPYLDVQSVSINDTAGNNNGAIDPQEVVKITVTLKNPWRAPTKAVASATATLTTSTPGVLISDASSTYGAIAAQGSAAGDTFQFRVPSNAQCGQSLNFTITPTSTLGSRAVNFRLRVGANAGNAPPVTYTRSALNLAIPDDAPRGVFDSTGLVIGDDLEINDLNVRIDSLTHTAVGDLTVMIKGPTGYGADIISATSIMAGGVFGGGGAGNNFTNTVIDDQAAGELLTATDASAPYTGSWKPAFTGAAWDTYPPTQSGHDTTGRLSGYNGTSTLGTWRLHVSDEGAVDTGTLQGYSLIVTPKAFTCSLVTAGSVSVSGRVLSPSGRGFGNAVVTLTDSSGTVRQVTTGGRGNFVFDDVEAGQTYVISVTSGQYSYEPQFITPNDPISGLIFSPQ